MAVTASIPTLWSSRILMFLDKALVAKSALTNTNYEGDITPGGTLKLLKIAEGTVEDYDGSLTAPADLTDSNPVTLTIDQKKAFNFKVDDVDSEMTVLKLVDEGSKRHGYKLADTCDSFILGLHASVDSANCYGDSTTPIVIGGGTGEVSAYDMFLQLNQLLDEANVPSQDRRAVLPPWLIRRLKKELGIKNTAGGDAIQASGKVLDVDGVQLFMSNNVPNTAGTKYKVLLGLPAITFAQAIMKTETYRVEASFATGVKGLHVYGATMEVPKALSLATVSKGDLSA